MSVMPYQLLYGIDIAIRKLRPTAEFGLNGTNIVDWKDPSGLQPPTNEEIQKQIEKDKKTFQEWQEKNKNLPYQTNEL